MGLFNWLFKKKVVRVPDNLPLFKPEPECLLDYDFMAREVLLENYNPNTGFINKVSAIRLFRERTGMGLKESKQYIDNNS